MSDVTVQIGPYRLLEILGEGGMGVVYRAEQLDPVRREVALKLIRAGAGSEVVVRRFESERQALAVMEHPSIARVYDAGVTDDGRPYFVMELVRGVPLLDYCDERHLGLADRIRLFAQVCRAVQHAHQKGVIHRDLKPSNILVAEADGKPLAKVIDFGIARATAVADDMTRLTLADEMIGTPAYMSPEQMSAGQDIDTRSDVYSLGVVLYELFTGHLPFDDAAYRGIAAFAAVQVREPPTPGKRVSQLGKAAHDLSARRGSDPTGLARALRGDLDWIVMKALEKERDRRYDTANALALDLERALANEPVLARSPTTTYRMRKFVRRHTVGVVSAAAIVLLLLAGVVLQAVQAGRVADARDEAIARRTQAEGLIDFMLGDLWEKLEPVGRLEILNDVGERAVAYFAEVDPQLFSDAEISSRSKMLYNIGNVRMRQGNSAAATPAFEESLRLARELSQRKPDDAEALFALGQSEFWVGSGYYRQGVYPKATTHFETYRDVSRRLVARDSTNDAWLRELGYSHTNVGAVALILGESGRAAEEFRQALVVKERVLAAAPDDRSLRYDVSRAHYNLAEALIPSGSLGGAIEALDRDIAMKRGLLALDSTNAVWRNTLVNSLFSRSAVANLMGQADTALAYLSQADVILGSLGRTDPTNRDFRRSLAMSGIRRAELLVARGELETARPLVAAGTATLQQMAAADTARLELRRDLAYAQAAWAALELRAGRPTDAHELATAAGAIVADSARLGTPRWVLRQGAGARVLAGRALAELGRAEEARALWREGEALALPLLAQGDDPFALAAAVEGLLLLARPADADPLLARLRSAGFREASVVQRLRGLGITY